MTTVFASASLARSTVKKLAAADDLPKILKDLEPRVLERALELAGGEKRRLTTDGDGSVIVWNYRVW